jgi:hypothetical protein
MYLLPLLARRHTGLLLMFLIHEFESSSDLHLIPFRYSSKLSTILAKLEGCPKVR